MPTSQDSETTQCSHCPAMALRRCDLCSDCMQIEIERVKKSAKEFELKKEALHLQVVLKAEESGIPCNDENFPALMKMAKSLGAPFVRWEFYTVGGMISARLKGAC